MQFALQQKHITAFSPNYWGNLLLAKFIHYGIVLLAKILKLEQVYLTITLDIAWKMKDWNGKQR